MTFDATKGGGADPRGLFVRSSLDGFSSNLVTASPSTVQPNLTSYNLNLGASAFQSVTGPITFRFYSYVASANAGQTMIFDNLSVNGATQAVPEPASIAALGLGVTVLLRRRKRA